MISALVIFLHAMVLIGIGLIGYALYLVWGPPAAVGYAGAALIGVAVVLIWYLEANQ